MPYWTSGDEGTPARLNDQLTTFIPHDPDRLGAQTSAIAAEQSDYPVGSMVDAAKRSSVYSGFLLAVPSLVKVVVIPLGTGNLAWYCTAVHAAVGESHTTHTDSIGSDGVPQTTAVTNGEVEEIDVTAAFTNAAAGDYFGFDFIRDGDDAGDTVGATVQVVGLIIEY